MPVGLDEGEDGSIREVERCLPKGAPRQLRTPLQVSYSSQSCSFSLVFTATLRYLAVRPREQSTVHIGAHPARSSDWLGCTSHGLQSDGTLRQYTCIVTDTLTLGGRVEAQQAVGHDADHWAEHHPRNPAAKA